MERYCRIKGVVLRGAVVVRSINQKWVVVAGVARDFEL